ncbi:pyridoxamine 5'-phosphate oxidase family protein [Acidisoma cellulosilytica]|uniref:Pyridoxamine 5'-phosphate oxidase family protein n=1 Tax=Acidisoma cellulosilyticum TaxID=2802395 RepID=A0A964E4Q6_9PROT|nr:pyridoxamine 5'-phosphate oxidase family protein [Acidisoma cellulosilyticum]MCB8881612.1 pyridoxamine 5'-phosphate oxidase family protein [Acidisoma cellulosilyticum]
MSDAETDPRFPVTNRSRVRREHHRGSYDKDAVYALLDAAPLCHVGYVIDGAPYVTPTLHWRVGNRIYWHGSAASRFLRQSEGMPVCITVSLMDGYVLARSAFNHSVNYRSVMAFGTAQKIEDAEEAAAALQHFTDGLFPGRWETLRPMTTQELKATSVLWMEIDEAVMKARTGGPGDAVESDFPVWAGTIPMHIGLGVAKPAPEVPEDCTLPAPLAALIASGRLR